MSKKDFRAVPVPGVSIERSTMDRSLTIKTTLNVGELVPVYVDEVLPGDSHKLNISAIARLTTPLYPTMDNLDLDYYAFFVPNRLVWDKWKDFQGENTQGEWAQPVEYTIPKLAPMPNNGPIDHKTLGASMVAAPGVNPNPKIPISALPFRAYKLIWNEWFRDQNLQSPLLINRGNTETMHLNEPLQFANKRHDYFTSALPSPQKGPSVFIPMSGAVPVTTFDELGDIPLGFQQNGMPMKMALYNDFNQKPSAGPLGTNNQGSTYAADAGDFEDDFPTTPINLWAVADVGDLQATVNDMRLAFQIQKIFEKDARGGTRYVEMLRTHFGVTSPDSRQQRPELIMHRRIPMGIQQVTQTTPDNRQGVGSLGAFGYASEFGGPSVTYSSTEHGYIIGLVVARHPNTYQQGIAKFWQRQTRFDFYMPALAHIGEQPIKVSEIYANLGDADVNKVFGYQEAWADYRYGVNRVTGQLASTYDEGSLDPWHYADHYASRPVLGAEWIKVTPNNVDRTLAVASTISDQIILDCYIGCISTRPMPTYSIPGYIDHF